MAALEDEVVLVGGMTVGAVGEVVAHREGIVAGVRVETAEEVVAHGEAAPSEEIVEAGPVPA
eukprot:4598357-Prymnesium_polylepis.1